jgi:hypothetical protein
MSPPLRATDRIIVFMRRPGAPPELDLGNPKASTKGWQPAGIWEELRASTVWLQEGVAYGYGQTINPGYSHLLKLRVTEEQIRNQIRSVLDLRAAMDRAVVNPDLGERAKQLATLVRTNNSMATYSALNHLTGGGPDAVQVLEASLLDPGLAQKYPLIAGTLAKFPTSETHFARILEGETSYWRRTCPSLQPNWYNGAFSPTAEAPETHWGITRELLAVRGLASDRDRAAVMELAEVWKTCPAIHEPGLDPITGAIDCLLRLDH